MTQKLRLSLIQTSVAFKDGLTHPSLFVLLVSLTFALLTPLLLELLIISGSLSHIPVGYLLRHINDDFISASWNVWHAQTTPPTSDRYYYMGGSASREGIQSPERLARSISESTGRESEVLLLSTPFRTFGLDLICLDNLPASSGTVIINVNLNYFKYSPEDLIQDLNGKKLPLRSKHLEAYLKSLEHLPENTDFPKIYNSLYGNTSLFPGIVSHLKGYFAERKTGLTAFDLEPLNYSQHKYTDKRRRNNLKQKQKHLQHFIERKQHIDTNFEFNAGLLQLIVETAREKQLKLVFFDTPMDWGIIDGALDQHIIRYRDEISKVAAKNDNVYHIRRNQPLDYTSHDFGDLNHLSFPNSRAKYERHLAIGLLSVL